MFDGPSTVNIDWTGRGLVLDLCSAVYHDADALRLVMIAAAGWLQAYLATPMGTTVPRRVQVIEEAWAVLGDTLCARYLQGCYKLSCSFGVANIAVAHRISDLRAQADDGTAAAKIAMALLRHPDRAVPPSTRPDRRSQDAPRSHRRRSVRAQRAATRPVALESRRPYCRGSARHRAHERHICDTDTNLAI